MTSSIEVRLSSPGWGTLGKAPGVAPGATAVLPAASLPGPPGGSEAGHSPAPGLAPPTLRGERVFRETEGGGMAAAGVRVECLGRTLPAFLRDLGRILGAARRRIRPSAAAGPHPIHRSLHLGRDGTLALLPGVGGLAMQGLEGTLLVTQEKDLEDHVLLPGARLSLAGRGRVVVWALTAAVVEVQLTPRHRG